MKSYFKHTVYCYPTERVNTDFLKRKRKGRRGGERNTGSRK